MGLTLVDWVPLVLWTSLGAIWALMARASASKVALPPGLENGQTDSLRYWTTSQLLGHPYTIVPRKRFFSISHQAYLSK